MPRADRSSNSPQPRIIRFRDAPAYLGMDRNRFNAEVRPYLTEVPIGAQGIGFDRLELDAWVDDYIARNGRPARKGANAWDAEERRASVSKRDLAHRQNGRRAANSAKHWNRRLEEAEAVLFKVWKIFAKRRFFGVRPDRTFEEAAAKFVLENSHKKVCVTMSIGLRISCHTSAIARCARCTWALFRTGSPRDGATVSRLAPSTMVCRSYAVSSI